MHAPGAVAAEVPYDLTATGGVPDQGDVAQVELVDDRREVVGVVVHVMPGIGLGRPAVPAPVVGDPAEAVVRDELQKDVPVVGIQRPAVAEYDGTARAPVLVEDVEPLRRPDRRHMSSS
jgi:hypothetical protein